MKFSDTQTLPLGAWHLLIDSRRQGVISYSGAGRLVRLKVLYIFDKLYLEIMKKLKCLTILLASFILGFSSKPRQVDQIMNVKEITSLRYFYGLRIPADPNDHECGTPLDVGLKRVEIDLVKKVAQFIWWDIDEKRSRVKYAVPIEHSEIDSIRKFLSELKYDQSAKERIERQDGYGSSEELFIMYHKDHNPTSQVIHLHTGKPHKVIEKMKRFETEATLFFDQFIQKHLGLKI